MLAILIFFLIVVLVETKKLYAQKVISQTGAIQSLGQSPVPICRLLHQIHCSRDLLFPSGLFPGFKKLKQIGNITIFWYHMKSKMGETIGITAEKLYLQNCT